MVREVYPVIPFLQNNFCEWAQVVLHIWFRWSSGLPKIWEKVSGTTCITESIRNSANPTVGPCPAFHRRLMAFAGQVCNLPAKDTGLISGLA